MAPIGAIGIERRQLPAPKCWPAGAPKGHRGLCRKSGSLPMTANDNLITCGLC